MAGRPWDAERQTCILTEKQVAFLEWLVDPDRQGSQTQFAASLGVDKGTLSKWKKDVFFKKAWDERLAELNVQPDRIQAVVEALYQAAVGGGQQSVKAMELYLRYVDRFIPKQEIVSSSGEAKEMTDEELAATMENVVALRQAK